jgi:hypothetical protein
VLKLLKSVASADSAIAPDVLALAKHRPYFTISLLVFHLVAFVVSLVVGVLFRSKI